MKKFLVALIVIPALVVTALYAVVLYNGPRMKVQPHFRAFQSVLPNLPAGTMPVQGVERLPTAGEAARLTNPLAGTAADRQRGAVYYRYYCVFCHGEKGDGSGPVGQSYIPVPADLRTARVKGYGDGELLRAMLTGVGHEPVLERVVPPQHRWYLVSFVRTLAR